MSNKYEREIEELLKQMDGQLRPEPIPFRVRRRTARAESTFKNLWRAFLRRSLVEQLMILSITLGLLSYVFHLFSGRLAFLAGIISVVLLVLAISISIVRQRGHGRPPATRLRVRERERDVASFGGGPFWWILIRDWWRRRRRF